MQHPDEGLIHAWLDGELSEKDASRVAALVESDSAWSAAAAEARGFAAASSRIMSALDRGPVMATTNATRRSATRRWWTIRAAAGLLVMVTAAALVRERWFDPNSTAARTATESDSPASATVAATAIMGSPARSTTGSAATRGEAKQTAKAAKGAVEKVEATKAISAKAVAGDVAPSPAPRASGVGNAQERVAAPSAAVGAAVAAPAVAAPVVGALRESRPGRSDTVSARQDQAFRPKAVVADAEAARDERRRVGAQGFAAPLPPPTPVAKRFDAPSRCFRMSQPPDSAGKMLRLSEAAVADGVRMKLLVFRGDTLASVATGIVAHATPCSVPQN